MASIGNLVLKLSLNSSQMMTGLAQTATSLVTFASHLRQSFGFVGDIIQGITSAVTHPITLAADLERDQAGMATILGDAEKARVLMEKIQKFAAETPFETPELITTARNLLAAGIAADDMTESLRVLGDVTAAVNNPNFGLSNLANVFSSIKGAGKLQGGDLFQLTQAGIGGLLKEQIAKDLGKGVGEIPALVEQGEISFQVFARALNRLTGEGGKFFNSMASQSQTFWGMWSTLSDNIGLAFTTLGQIIIDAFDLKGAIGKLQGVTEWIRNNVAALKPVFETAGGVATTFFDTILAAGSGLGELFQPLLDSMKAFDGNSGTIRANVIRLFEVVTLHLNRVKNSFIVFGGVVLGQVLAPIITSFAQLNDTMSTLMLSMARATAFAGGDPMPFLEAAAQAKIASGIQTGMAGTLGELGAKMMGTALDDGSEAINDWFGRLRKQAEDAGKGSGDGFIAGFVKAATRKGLNLGDPFQAALNRLPEMMKANVSPLEKFTKEMAKLNEVQRAQFGPDLKIDAALERGVAGMVDELEKSVAPIAAKGPEALVEGSAAAISAILKAQRHPQETEQQRATRILEQLRAQGVAREKHDQEVARVWRKLLEDGLVKKVPLGK